MWPIFLIYITGIVLWAFIWKKAKGYQITHYSKLAYIPFILVFFILISQILLVLLLSSRIGQFEEELALIKIIETNTLQLIQSNVGVLIIAPIIISIVGKAVPRAFIIFQTLSICFIAGGVLPIYWTPATDGVLLFYLRHIKTVPYTIGIGCLITGIIVLLHHLIPDRKPQIDDAAGN